MDIVHQIISLPWALPAAVGVAALVLGLLIPRRGGASWLVAILFFLPNLFLDFLDMVHTKKFKYYGLITALLAIEAFFAFRAATVYYDVLNTRMPAPEMAIVCVIVFIAVFLCGYMVATHGKFTFWSVCTMIFVIVHDWAGTLWMNYSTAATATTTASINTPDDPLKLVLTIGMCVLGLLPFIMGAWTEELRPQLEQELEEEVNAFTSTATRKIKRRAVERVLRLANHTNIVQLVRALPADEFTEFKQFVMPIIAPGVSYDLVQPDLQPESTRDELHDDSQRDMSEESQNELQEDMQNATILTEESLPELQPENHQNELQESSQMDGILIAEDQSEDQSNELQNESHRATHDDQQKSAKVVARKRSSDTSKTASKTARRDTRIREFAAAHHEFTHAKLAAKFSVSVSTISRVLSPQNATAPVQPLEIAEPSHNGHNGHHKERDTDKLKAVEISEADVLSMAHQN